MNQKGFAVIPLLTIAGIIILAGILFFQLKPGTSSQKNQSISQSTEQPTASPQTSATSNPSSTPLSAKTTPNPSASAGAKSSCNTSKDVCFSQAQPKVSIQEGYLEDANYWVSKDLLLTGKGSGGYDVSISGFPKEFSVRVQDQNFLDGGTEPVILRAQKNVAPKGTYTGTISVRSYVTNNTITVPLTLSYVDWTPSAIHSDPSVVNMDCTVRERPVYGGKELYCGSYDSELLRFYYFKNNKIIEVKTVAENNASRSLSLTSNNSTVLTTQDVSTLLFYPKGYDDQNLLDEPDGVYKGYFLFFEQATNKEVLRVPYTLTIHAFKS